MELKGLAPFIIQGNAERIPLADKSVDLVFTSPPYITARLYLEGGRNLGVSRKCEAWIEWMLAVVKECCRVSSGLVLINCAGVTKSRCYQPGPEGLLYRWWQQGGQCWRPAYWNRVGIPGSGGEHWLRADVEYVLAFKAARDWPEWTDNTANGHPPKWGPGGEMSYRLGSGARVNQWGGVGSAKGMGAKMADGSLKPSGRPSHVEVKMTPFGPRCTRAGKRPDGSPNGNYFNGNGFKKRHTKSRADGSDEVQEYEPPVLANPGNFIQGDYALLRIIDKLAIYGCTKKINSDSILRELRNAVDAEAVRRWWAGVLARVFEASLLQSQVPRDDDQFTGWSKAGGSAASRQEDRASDQAANRLREMRDNETAGGSPQGRGCDEQSTGESSGPLYEMPSCDAQKRGVLGSRLHEAILGDEILFDSLLAVEEVWRSFNEGYESPLGTAEGGFVVHSKVGGGQLGSSLSHLNEAPFGEDFAAWFIKSYCPPGGRVLDPFSGSGTTAKVARSLGRVGIGMDLRWSQCQLGTRRLAEPERAAKSKRAKVKHCPEQSLLFTTEVA